MSTSDHCATLVRETDRDRYLATLFAPEEKRAALFAVYAFAGEIARVRDVAREPMPGEIRLQWWREVLEGKRDGEAAAHPVAAALLAAIKRHRLSPETLIALIDAHVFDLYDEPFATLDDLDNYAVLTEGALISTAGQILGGMNAASGMLIRHAAIALTIAKVLLALPHHAVRHQLYVPLEVLERHSVSSDDIFAGRDSDQLKAALAELRRHARRQLQAAMMDGGQVPVQLMPALLPLALVSPQLARMDRRGYEPFLPEPLSRLRRQWLLWRAARDPQRIFGQ
jgi:phytoene synthase